MFIPRSQPNTLEGWMAYANSENVTSIPLREAQIVNKEAKIATLRGVYLEASTALVPSMRILNVYSDILAFTKQEVTVSPYKHGTIKILARVLTADAPVNIVVPSDASGAVAIYATIVDQPITVSTAGESITLDLGPESENVGVAFSFSAGKMQYEYEQRQLTTKSDDLKASMNTQLRIALVQFWKNPSIAISLCSYVAALTTEEENYRMLNTQAVALGQQLAGQAMAGSNMSYAPILVLDRYKETTRQALRATTAFEHQFERFQDKKESLHNQILAWDTMISQAENERSMRIKLCERALEKYESATEIMGACHKQFEDDNSALESASKKFQKGVAQWQHDQEMKAAFEIFSAIVTFAIGIGEICLGNPGGGAAAGAAVDQAVKAVSKAEKILNQVGKFLKSATFKKIADCSKALYELGKLVKSIVDALKQFQLDPSVKIPFTDKISGTSKGDADAAAIVTMAAWDKWVLESDQQLEFAVQQGVGGASDYRLVLRKHAINGKQLAQTQTEAIKAGHEYVQAQMEVTLSRQQIDGLQKLKDEYKGQEAIHAQAEAMFYDRAMAFRTNVVISLRNMAWAYRYWALSESSIVLDAWKPLAEYERDLSTIISEMEHADSRYPNDFQPFEYGIKSKTLPAGYGPSMIDALKKNSHAGSFTLLPGGSLASKFNKGSHYRLNGLNPTLRGVLPNPEKVDDDGEVEVQLQITTSGIYADIDKTEIFYFQCLPQIRRCTYALDRHGVRGKTSDNPTFDTKDHAEPTPFTQWTIKLLNPEDLVLDELEGIDMVFSGHVRFDKQYHLEPEEEEEA